MTHIHHLEGLNDVFWHSVWACSTFFYLYFCYLIILIIFLVPNQPPLCSTHLHPPWPTYIHHSEGPKNGLWHSVWACSMFFFFIVIYSFPPHVFLDDECLQWPHHYSLPNSMVMFFCIYFISVLKVFASSATLPPPTLSLHTSTMSTSMIWIAQTTLLSMLSGLPTTDGTNRNHPTADPTDPTDPTDDPTTLNVSDIFFRFFLATCKQHTYRHLLWATSIFLRPKQCHCVWACSMSFFLIVI